MSFRQGAAVDSLKRVLTLGVALILNRPSVRSGLGGTLRAALAEAILYPLEVVSVRLMQDFAEPHAMLSVRGILRSGSLWTGLPVHMFCVLVYRAATQCGYRAVKSHVQDPKRRYLLVAALLLACDLLVLPLVTVRNCQISLPTRSSFGAFTEIWNRRGFRACFTGFSLTALTWLLSQGGVLALGTVVPSVRHDQNTIDA